MRSRLSIAAVALAVLVTATSTAYAYDCIRVSSSRQGLIQSSKSGNWLPFDFGSADGVQGTFADVFEVSLTPEQSACIANEYAMTGQPRYFALGIGVAGGKKQSTTSNGARAGAGGFGVIAWHNKNYRVLSDGHGIDHIDDSPILSALFASAGACDVPIVEE